MREFNTAGPVVAADHYLIPSLSRLDLNGLLGLVHRKKYFVLHAPRQTGKTSRVAGAARSHQPAWRVSLRVRDGRERAVGARGRRGGYACRPGRAGLPGGPDPGRRFAGGHVAGRAGARRSARRAAPGVDALVPGRSEASGSADRRDRRPHRGHPAVGAAPVARGLPGSPRPLSTLRHSVRRGRRARLPHPFERRERAGARRQRLQHQVGVVAARRLHRDGGAVPARPAHRGDRAGVYGGGVADGLDAHGRPAVARERPVLRRLLQERGRARSLELDHARRRAGGAGAADPAPRHAHRPVGVQAARGAGAAGRRTHPRRG